VQSVGPSPDRKVPETYYIDCPELVLRALSQLFPFIDRVTVFMNWDQSRRSDAALSPFCGSHSGKSSTSSTTSRIISTSAAHYDSSDQL